MTQKVCRCHTNSRSTKNITRILELSTFMQVSSGFPTIRLFVKYTVHKNGTFAVCSLKSRRYVTGIFFDIAIFLQLINLVKKDLSILVTGWESWVHSVMFFYHNWLPVTRHHRGQRHSPMLSWWFPGFIDMFVCIHGQCKDTIIFFLKLPFKFYLKKNLKTCLR